MSAALLEAPTVWELVRRRAEASPDQPMLLDATGRVVTFGEFAVRTERVAAGLQALGVGPESAVTWQLPTRIESILVAMALARLGATQNPIIHLYREREVGAVLRQSQPQFFVVPGVWRDRDFESMAKTLRQTWTGARAHRGAGRRPARWRPVDAAAATRVGP